MSFSRPRSGEFWNGNGNWSWNGMHRCGWHVLVFTLRLRLTAAELLPLLFRLLLLLLLLWLLLLLLPAMKQLFVITFDDVDCMVGSAFPATGFVLLPMVSSLTAWLPESLAHVAFVLLLLIFTKRCLWCFWVLLLLGPPCDDPLNEWKWKRKQEHQWEWDQQVTRPISTFEISQLSCRIWYTCKLLWLIVPFLVCAPMTINHNIIYPIAGVT